jgi:hypothetical protein
VVPRQVINNYTYTGVDMRFTLVPIIAALMLTGCATGDYKMYADAQKAKYAGESAAEVARYKALSDIAQNGDPSAKIAAVMAIALGGKGGGTQTAAAEIKAPESVSTQLMQWTGLLLPSLIQGYGIRANTQMGMKQSDNAALIAKSTNDTMLGIAGKIQAPAANVSTTTTSNTTDSHNTANPVTTTTTLSGTGTLGGGSYSTAANPTTTTTTTTLSGTGTLGSGSYAANPVTTTTLSGTGTLGSGSYATTANPVTTTTLSGTGTVGGGAYTTTDTHAVSTTTTDNHAVDTHAVSTTTDTHATTDNHTTNPVTTVTVPAGKVCTIDAAGALTCL